MSRRGWMLFIALSVIWGVPYLLIKVAVEHMSPSVLVFGRTALAAAVLLPVALARGQMGAVVRHWRWVLAFSVIEVALPFGLLGVAEQRISSSLAGLLVAAVGLVAAGYAIGPVIASLRLGMLPGMAVSAASVSVVAALYAVPAWITRPAAPSALPATAWIAVAVLGVVCTAVGLLLFFALVAEVGPARATVITYVNPAVAVVLGVALLAEPITVGILIGFPLVLLGSYLATRHSGVAAPGTEGAPPLRADGDDSGTSREEGSLSPTSPTSRAASSGTSS